MSKKEEKTAPNKDGTPSEPEAKPTGTESSNATGEFAGSLDEEDDDDGGFIGDDEEVRPLRFMLDESLTDALRRRLLGDTEPEGGRSLNSALDLLAPIAAQLLARELSKSKPLTAMTTPERQEISACAEACAKLGHELVQACMVLIANDARAEKERQEALSRTAS